MRHLGSFLLSVVLAPVIWALSGVGTAKLAEGVGLDRTMATLVGLLALLGAGLAYTVLVLVRLSPVGPALAGLAFLGACAWAAVDRGSFVDLMPGDLLGVPGALWAPAAGTAALLSVPLIATLGSPRRWRRYAGIAAGTQPTLYGRPAGATYTTPAGGMPGYGTPDAVYVPPPPSYPTETETTRPLPPTG